MFMGERLGIVQRIILTDDEHERNRSLEQLRTTQTADFEDLLREMDGLPVIVRLLDPPLHEFLPDSLEIGRDMLERVRAGEPTEDLELLDRQVRRWSEERGENAEGESP